MSQKQSNTTSYLQQCNEEKEGVGCPPELWVEEPGKEGEDVIFGCAEDGIKQETRPRVEEGDKRERDKWLVLKICSQSIYIV